VSEGGGHWYSGAEDPLHEPVVRERRKFVYAVHSEDGSGPEAKAFMRKVSASVPVGEEAWICQVVIECDVEVRGG